MINAANGRHASLAGVLLALFTFLTYWPAARFDFVNYDDPYYVIHNPNIQQGLTGNSLTWAFTTGHARNWHPVTWVSHMIDFNLFGLKAGGHHLTNALIHSLNALLMFLIFHRMTGALWRSAMVAALFALHPLHVESVAWISERKDVLSTFFWALTILAYLAYARKPAWDRYALILLLFILALMTKPMVVTLPFLLLLLDFWPLRRISGDRTILGVPLSASTSPETPFPRFTLGKLLWEKVPLLLLTAGACVLTLWAQRGTIMPLEGLPFMTRLGNAGYSYLRYVWRMVWPQNLVVHYPYTAPNSVWFLLLLTCFFVGIGFLMLRLGRTRPYLITGGLWFFGTLIPTIGLVQVGTQAMADRYTYVPLVGLFLIVVWGAYDFFNARRLKPSFATGAAVVVLVACVSVTRVQLSHWQNSARLWQHAVDVMPNHALAHFNLGVAALEQRDLERAKDSFERATRFKPSYSDAWNNLGYVMAQLGKPDVGINYYQLALRFRPDYGLAHYNLGLALAELGRIDEALAEFQTALQQAPEIRTLHRDIGQTLLKQGHPEQAATHLRQYMSRQPDDVQGYLRLGQALRRSGAEAEARQCFVTAASLEPKLVEETLRMAQAFSAAGNSFAAEDLYTLLVDLNPDDAEVRERFGMMLAAAGKVPFAMTNFNELLRLRPDAQSHYNLALAYVVQKDAKTAVDHYRQALKLKPDWPPALNDLAWILATHPEKDLRNGNEAVQLAERACALTQPEEARFCGTRDAAYAEAGRFPEAIQMAEHTRQLALAAGDTNLVQSAEQRLALYRQQQPFRQNPSR